MLAGIIDRIAGMDFGMNLGRGFLLTLFYGLSEGVVDAVTSASGGRVPPAATGLVGSFLIGRLGPVQRFLGPTGASVFQVSLVANALDDQFAISDSVRNFIAGIGGSAPAAGALGTTEVREIAAAPQAYLMSPERKVQAHLQARVS